MSKIKEFIRKKKVLLIVIAIIIVLAVVISTLLVKNRKSSQTEEFTYTRTVTLGYGSLQETIVASGTIESQNTSTVTASTNAQVSKINYSIGDYVNEGDVVIELDKSSINKQITKAQDSVDDAEEKLQDSYDSAVSSKDTIWENWYEASETLESAKSAYNSAKSKVSEYQKAYDSAYATYTSEAESLLKQGCTISNSQADCDGVDTAAFESAKKTLKTAEDNLNTIKSTTNYESLKKAYESASSSYEQLTNQLNSANAQVEKAKDSLEEGVDSDNLSDLYDSLEDYQLTAKSSGQITSLNAVVGSSANGTLATIQDTSKLKISLTIDEYDIFKVELGQRATIETDASDIVYEGEVSQISPVASGGMGSSGFEIEVEVTSEDVSKLLIGMSAEVTIIISETEENFSVPIDAVETKEDGSQIVYVENESGEFSEVEVTTGENNGYYIEIFSDELSVGMKVRASADAQEAEVNISEDMDFSEMGGFSFDMGQVGGGGDMPSGGGGGNMPSGGGGGMPSGGGNFPGGN